MIATADRYYAARRHAGNDKSFRTPTRPMTIMVPFVDAER